jgi:hypothetical protein
LICPTRGALVCVLTLPKLAFGDVGPDAAEHNVVEQVEHFGTRPEFHPRQAKVSSHAHILVEEARVAQIERERARRVSVRKRRRRLEGVAVDVRPRYGSSGRAVHRQWPEAAAQPRRRLLA